MLKRQQSHEPIISMSKSEVEAQRLTDYIIMPADQEMSFKKWWEASAVVEVRYPHERHSNAGKPSHLAKSSVMDDFLKFVANQTVGQQTRQVQHLPPQVYHYSDAQAWNFTL